MAIVTGWGLIHDNIQRFTRSVKSPGAVTDAAIADACNDALQEIMTVIIQSGQPWMVRSKVIDDTALGSTVEFRTKRLFIEEDLGVTDLAKAYKLYRVDPSNQVISKPIFHCNETGSENVERGAWINRWGDERWREDGDFNADSNYDMSILLYNAGSAMAGGFLKITYWFTPDIVTEDVFTQVDANGDRTARPPLPKQFWSPLQSYAKLVLLETTGDEYKSNALWKRWGGPEGVLNKCRVLAGSFQLGEPNMVKDAFADEVNYDG